MEIGTEFLREMAWTAQQHRVTLPDRELACAPIHSELGQRYLGARRPSGAEDLRQRMTMYTSIYGMPGM
ncbi:MAG TPA: RtcB family protein [Duganella sp.]|nr:RtcB family protein [Duganella sp.]